MDNWGGSSRRCKRTMNFPLICSLFPRPIGSIWLLRTSSTFMVSKRYHAEPEDDMLFKPQVRRILGR